VGQVALEHFVNSGNLSNLVEDQLKKVYEDAFQRGKSYVSDLEDNQQQAADVYQALEKLGKLREQGILTEEEFQAKKQQLLTRL
jgi:predicted Zn-dependent peptidase